jgi:anaerobic magnesium-protoporphyrin IX monomethyl ester cyclase
MSAKDRVLYLVNPGNDPPYRHGIAYNASFPPLGVISLATAVQEVCMSWDVKVLDGQVIEQEQILRFIEHGKPLVLGVSVLAMTYQNSLEIARAGKRVGSITLFGNDQAAITGRNMLRVRPEIDYICTADAGEKSLLQFLEFVEGKRPVGKVANLLYRDGAIVRRSDAEHEREFAAPFEALDLIPIPDRTLLSVELRTKYLQNYMRSHPRDTGATGVSTINRFRGCARKERPCTFCGIADLTIRASSPKMFWRDVRAAYEIGANRLYEAGDSVSSVPKYLERLLREKPSDLRWNAMVYTSARETSRKLIELYKGLGVFRANMGLESGDEVVLRRLKGTGDSSAQNVKAVKLLKEAGIPVYSSFVLGGPGETAESLENTVKFVRWLLDNQLIDGVGAHPLFPELNAVTGHLLLHAEEAISYANREGFKLRNVDLLRWMSDRWGNHENPDPLTISEDWAEIFCSVPFATLQETARRITDYAETLGMAGGSFFTDANDNVEAV